MAVQCPEIDSSFEDVERVDSDEEDYSFHYLEVQNERVSSSSDGVEVQEDIIDIWQNEQYSDINSTAKIQKDSLKFRIVETSAAGLKQVLYVQRIINDVKTHFFYCDHKKYAYIFSKVQMLPGDEIVYKNEPYYDLD